MPLRYQLLLLSLLTLLLPWAGCQYAREMETVLREGQEQALLASATTIASLVAAKPELMAGTLSDEPAQAGMQSLQRSGPFDPRAGDLYAYSLKVAPLLDGYPDDWALPEDAFMDIAAPNAAVRVRYLAGTNETNLYLLLEVADPDVALEQDTDATRAPEERSDHVWIAFATPEGEQASCFFATTAPGLLSARRPTVSSYGQRGEQLEARIQAYWQPDPRGYRLEARIPLSLVGSRFGFEVVDSDGGGSELARAGTLHGTERIAVGRLMRPSAVLGRELESFLPPAARVVIADNNGWILGEAGSVESQLPTYEERPAEWLQTLYRGLLESGGELPLRSTQPGRLAGRPIDSALGGRRAALWQRVRDEHRSVLSVATPILSDTQQLGVLMLEQAGDRLLILRDRALTRLLNLTLLAAVAAVLATLAFATILGMRLARLKRAAETALTPDGRLNVVIPGTARGDELGDVARSYAALLQRLNDYTSYLRTLGGKLSHELRTPLTIVRSSLDNLESEGPGAGNAACYLARAREGTERLQAILTAMSAATRTEEAIQQAERVRFDLRSLLDSITRAYADAFRERRFEARLAEGECFVVGAPELIVQLLDKLVDNAVDFSEPGTAIAIELDTTPGECTISVTNTGPPIAADVLGRLFDPTLQYRRGSGNRPHFGLGLFIVRLVADFHGGRVAVVNLESGEPSGEGAPACAVRFSVQLPRVG